MHNPSIYEIMEFLSLPNEIPRELDLKPITYLDHFAKPETHPLMRRPCDADITNDLPLSEI